MRALRAYQCVQTAFMFAAAAAVRGPTLAANVLVSKTHATTHCCVAALILLENEQGGISVS